MLSIHSLNYTKKKYITLLLRKRVRRSVIATSGNSVVLDDWNISTIFHDVCFVCKGIRRDSPIDSCVRWKEARRLKHRHTRKQLQKNTVELRGSHHRGTVIFVISSPRITYADVRDQWNRSLLSSRTIHDTTCLTSNIPVGTIPSKGVVYWKWFPLPFLVFCLFLLATKLKFLFVSCLVLCDCYESINLPCQVISDVSSLNLKFREEKKLNPRTIITLK